MKINYLAALVCSLTILFAACTKITSTNIGTDLIPAVDGVNTRDTTITVYAKNAGTDTISPTLSQLHVLGNVEDPLFGNTNARINFQLSLPSSNFYFESTKPNLFLDSVVLVLSYNGVWGDSTRPVSLFVNELDNSQTFLPDTTAAQYDSYGGYAGTYNNTVNFAASNSLTSTPATVFPTRLADSVHAYKDSGINMIRIRLNDDFGRRLLDYDTLTAYKNDSTFHNYLKGLQVFADPNTFNNALLKIGLKDANTKLALYYHYHPADSASTVSDTTVKYFMVTGDCAHSNYIVRDRSKGEVNAYLPPNSNPADTSDNLIYIQAGPGTYATVTIDSSALSAMPNYIIHRAELLIEQATDASDTYFTPPNLFLLAKNDTSRFVIPGYDTSNVSTADAVFASSYLSNYSSFGGVPKLNTTNNSLYTFNVSQYVQGVVTKHNRQHPFVLYAPYNEPFKLYEVVPYTTSRGYISSTPPNDAACGRVRLYGGGGDLGNIHRMRLHVVYSIPH